MGARFRILAAAVLFAAALAAPLPAAVTILIINADDPGVGFNDPTPATPIGGNTGTTVGEQRLQAFQYAADLWGALLDSNAEIRIHAQFKPLDCTATDGTLGAAGPSEMLRDFPNAPEPNTWYAAALASALAGRDLLPGTDVAEIRAQFNSNIGTSGCLETDHWYYGLDSQHGDSIDLVTVLLHEFAHGLGFETVVDPTTGAEFMGVPDIFEKHILDDSTNTHWGAMTAPERQASTINTGAVAMDSPRVTAAVPTTLRNAPTLSITAPASIAGDVTVGTAAFGAPLTTAGVSGALVALEDPGDAAGPSTTDGCSAATNASAVAGHVALVDRGTCSFVQKALTAQAAGATALVVANNAAGTSVLGMAGSDSSITIVVVSVTQADGATLRQNLAAGVTVNLLLDPSRRSGADGAGRMLLYAPNPVVEGSSTSHWDTSAYPPLLMQPNLGSDLTHGVDLTLPLLQDLGWPAAAPPLPPGEPRGAVDAVEHGPEHPRVIGPRP